MDTPQEARDYDAMDHGEVNRAFVDDFLRAASDAGLRPRPEGSPIDVLDVGPGTALIPIELGRRDDSGHVTAVDLSREMLKLAAQNVAHAGLTGRVAPEFADSKRLTHPDG